MGVTQPLLGILERGTSQGRKYWCLFKSQRMILRWFHSCSMSAFDEWCAALDLLLSKDWTLLLSCATRFTIMLLRLLEHPSPFFNPRKNAPRSQRSTHRKVLSAIRILDLHILYFKGQNLKYKRTKNFWCFIHFSFPIIAFYVCFPLLTQIDPPSLLTRGYFSLSAYLGGFYGKKVYFYSLQHHEAALKDCWSTRFSTLTQFSHQVSK